MKSTPIPDWQAKEATYTDDSLIIDGYQVMMDWETPIMHTMAAMLCEHADGDILEVGFGMGISATEIVRLGVKSYTVVEPHPEVYQRALKWKEEHADTNIRIVQGFWQSALDDLERFDGIFFDTFSATREEIDRKRFDFFQAASDRLLRPGGALTFFYWIPVWSCNIRRSCSPGSARCVSGAWTSCLLRTATMRTTWTRLATRSAPWQSSDHVAPHGFVSP